jgi:hypothetical protein
MPLLTELVSSEGGFCYRRGAPNGALAGFIPLRTEKGVLLSRKLVPSCTSSRYAEKRQRAGALQDAGALSDMPEGAKRLGVR